MTDPNDDNSRSNDWADDPESDAVPETQSPVQGDQPQPAPPRQPDSQRGPGPQGPRVSAGGEWDAGHDMNMSQQSPRSGPSTQGVGESRQHQPPTANRQPPVKQGSGSPKLDNDDILAIVLSALFPGVGQMIKGQQTKGIVVLLVAIFTGFVFGLLSVASALDTYCVVVAQKKRPVDEWEFFPDLGDLF